GNRKSYHYGAEGHKREKKLKHLEEQNHRDSDNIHSIRFNKVNSGSIQKYESRSSCSGSSRSSQESSVLNTSSYKDKNRSTITDMDNFADIKCHVDDFAKSEQFDVLWHPMLERKNLLADFGNDSNKTKLDGKKCFKNVAVQTVHLEQNCDLLPMFTPLLLKDIEENMKEMNEREVLSTIIQTHVNLIRRQAQREKRMLEEWDSAISDLEERCQFVNFERLKLLLHSNDYFYTS
ncbi:unnamed protein product, partial [Onchocerca flexuosa]